MRSPDVATLLHSTVLMGKDEGMRRRPAAALVASLVLLALTSGVPGRLAGTRPAEAPAPAAALDALAALPLGFEPNVGQAGTGTDFVVRGPGYRLALTANAADLVVDGTPLRMRLVGSDPAAAATPGTPLPGHTNYLTGRDPAGWRTHVPTYTGVTYSGVWPGVDVVYQGDRRRLRHDFVVAPGTDPSTIAVAFDAGADGVGDVPTVDPATGDLLVGDARLSRPTVYQDVDGAHRPVDGAFRISDDGRVGFDVGSYDRTRPLVIDPTLVTSSYLGGAGIDNAAAVDVDGGGNVYIVGSTESTDFRATNPFQNTLNTDGSTGKSDAFVAKLSADGASLLYATYLGGSNRDAAGGVAVASDGTLYVTGVTESENFPRTDGVAQGAYGGGPSDAFVTKLNPTGSGLAWSTFLGGAQTDAARAIAVNGSGEAFVTGSTNSVAFPAVNPLQTTAPEPDDVDAFVTKVSFDGTSFGYSTRLGGSNDDRGLDIAVDATSNAYVTGDTRSPGFPTARPLQAGAGGSSSGVAGSFSDAFLSKFGPAGDNLVYSTFLGGSDTDQGVAVTVDSEGAAYVTGTTNSPNFPVKVPLQALKDSDTDAFVTQVNPAGSDLVYSTYLGGGGADSGMGIMVDRTGSVTVVGVTGSSNFPTAKPIQGVKGGGATDAFVSTLAPGGGTLVSSSYLGGREDDQATGVAVGPGAATPVVVGSTSSADFPTAKPLQSARAGTTADAFVTRISAAEEASTPTSIGTGGAGTPVPAKSGTHDKRVRLLVATTAGLFLIAVLQTAYLRRKAAAESAQWGGPAQPAPLLPPPPAQTWGGGVRVIEEEADDNVFASIVDDDRSAGLAVTAGSSVAVPDLLDEEDWVAPAAPPRPAPRVPLEELSFWDLFPEDLPPSRRPGGADDTDWALEDQEDVLVRPGASPSSPPLPPPPPPPPIPWSDVDAGAAAPPPPPPADDNLLLTELLDLSPAATQAANAAHYGNLIESGGGDVGRRRAAADEDGDTDGEDEDADTEARTAGSGPGSRPPGSGTRKPRPKGSGKRRRKPGQGGPSGGGGGGTGGPRPGAAGGGGGGGESGSGGRGSGSGGGNGNGGGGGSGGANGGGGGIGGGSTGRLGG